MFYTSPGTIGKYLRSVKVGDELRIIPDSQKVFVLRLVEGRNDGISRYRLVGPCVCTNVGVDGGHDVMYPIEIV